MKKYSKIVKDSAIVFALTIIFFELASFLATKSNLFLVNETPTIYNASYIANVPDEIFGRTEDDVWGAWHKENSSLSQTSPCFDITMNFNEIGARDSSFNNIYGNSVILLGDSFAEGWGVRLEDTSQYLIESKLDISVLNFGAAMNFGPLQELLLYKKYRTIPHNGVLVYVLPANDFVDNDPDYWRNIDKTRYRPYFSKIGNPLNPYYFPEAIKRETLRESEQAAIKQFLKKYFWSTNALRTFLRIKNGEVTSSDEDKAISYYYDANQRQQINLVQAYEELLNLTGSKDVIFVIIPSQNDIDRYKYELDSDRYKNQIWYKKIKEFEDRPLQNVTIINLMDHLPNEADSLFFSCDSHWSEIGNEWASDIIVDNIIKAGIFGLQNQQ